MAMTTITISKETRNRLAKFGDHDSTFDDIIQKLIKQWKGKN